MIFGKFNKCYNSTVRPSADVPPNKFHFNVILDTRRNGQLPNCQTPKSQGIKGQPEHKVATRLTICLLTIYPIDILRNRLLKFYCVPATSTAFLAFLLQPLTVLMRQTRQDGTCH